MLEAFSASDLSKSDPNFERLNNAIVAASRLGPGWVKLADDWDSQVFSKRAALSVLAPIWNAKLNEFWEKYTLLWVADRGPGGVPTPLAIAPESISEAKLASYKAQVEKLLATPIPPVVGGKEEVKHPVLELQKILLKLGYPSTTAYIDGQYGPKTKAAWQTSAKARGLNPQFDRASATEAIVNATTYTALAKAKVVIPLGPSMPSPVPGPEPGPLPAPATGGGVPIGTVLLGVGVLGLGAWLLMQKRPAFAR